MERRHTVCGILGSCTSQGIYPTILRDAQFFRILHRGQDARSSQVDIVKGIHQKGIYNRISFVSFRESKVRNTRIAYHSILLRNSTNSFFRSGGLAKIPRQGILLRNLGKLGIQSSRLLIVVFNGLIAVRSERIFI